MTSKVNIYISGLRSKDNLIEFLQIYKAQIDFVWQTKTIRGIFYLDKKIQLTHIKMF